MKPYRYHSEAREELLAAAAFYESQQPGLARKFLRAVMTAIESMQFDPKARPSSKVKCGVSPCGRLPTTCSMRMNPTVSEF